MERRHVDHAVQLDVQVTEAIAVQGIVVHHHGELRVFNFKKCTKLFCAAHDLNDQDHVLKKKKP